MIGFNLSTYHYTNKRIKLLSFIFLSASAILFSCYNYISYIEIDKKLELSTSELITLQNKISTLKQSLSEKKRPYPSRKSDDFKTYISQVKNINQIIEKKAFSWSELFYALEKASPKGISIKGIRPSYSSRKVKITGVAKNLDAIMLLLKNLNSSKYFKQSHLLNEKSILIDNRYPAVAFDIDSEGNF